jgi:hypothetical protein
VESDAQGEQVSGIAVCCAGAGRGYGCL